MEVLLEVQLLFEGLDAILSVHPPQHLILQLLLGIGQTGVQLRKEAHQELNISIKQCTNIHIETGSRVQKHAVITVGGLLFN